MTSTIGGCLVVGVLLWIPAGLLWRRGRLWKLLAVFVGMWAISVWVFALRVSFGQTVGHGRAASAVSAPPAPAPADR